MLRQQTIETLERLKLFGMLKALSEQEKSPSSADFTFEERFGLLLDREAAEQETRIMTTRLRKAKLRLQACLEDVDYRTPRGMEKSLLIEMGSCAWIREHLNAIIIGPTGIGKTYLACGLGHKACREGFSVLYQRVGNLMYELSISRGEGRYIRMLKTLAQPELLILDDWGLESFQPESRRDFLEILEDRHGRKSTLITTQIPTNSWHTLIGDPTLADAILDRVVHNAYIFNLKGESMRKKTNLITKTKKLTESDHHV